MFKRIRCKLEREMRKKEEDLDWVKRRKEEDMRLLRRWRGMAPTALPATNSYGIELDLIEAGRNLVRLYPPKKIGEEIITTCRDVIEPTQKQSHHLEYTERQELKRIRDQISDAGEEADQLRKNPRFMAEVDKILEDIEEKEDEQREPPERITQLEKLLRAAMKDLLEFV